MLVSVLRSKLHSSFLTIVFFYLCYYIKSGFNICVGALATIAQPHSFIFFPILLG